MGTYIVEARTDGRGGARPFGLSAAQSKHFAGTFFQIGDKNIKVTTDGRINIPKKIMKEWGTTGDNGRQRISVQYKSIGGKKGSKHTGQYYSAVVPLLKSNRNLKTGMKVVKFRERKRGKLMPADIPDAIGWSPV